MDISTLITPSRTVTFDFEGLPGLKFDLCYQSRQSLLDLTKECTETKYNRTTKQAEESLDTDKFLREYSQAVIKGWSGFKLKYLEEFLLVDRKDMSPDDEVPYSPESAETLLKNSEVFDTWIQDKLGDLGNFSQTSSKTFEPESENS